MMVKSGLQFILKFTEPLQRYLLSCQANSAILGRYFCTGLQQLWRGSVNFKINSRPLSTIIFKLKNGNFMTRDFSPLIKRVLVGVGPSSSYTSARWNNIWIWNTDSGNKLYFLSTLLWPITKTMVSHSYCFNQLFFFIHFGQYFHRTEVQRKKNVFSNVLMNVFSLHLNPSTDTQYSWKLSLSFLFSF